LAFSKIEAELTLGPDLTSMIERIQRFRVGRVARDVADLTSADLFPSAGRMSVGAAPPSPYAIANRMARDVADHIRAIASGCH
jgi:hypothetical protein